jgi:hypothetical protein
MQPRRERPNKALQLPSHSAFQSLASTGASATVSGLCHAAERPVRYIPSS